LKKCPGCRKGCHYEPRKAPKSFGASRSEEKKPVAPEEEERCPLVATARPQKKKGRKFTTASRKRIRGQVKSGHAAAMMRKRGGAETLQVEEVKGDLWINSRGETLVTN